MVDMGMWFNVQANSLSSTIPTELGNLVKMSSRIQLGSNSFTMSIPTQLGRISKMTHNFLLYSNKLCADTPTQVQALSSSVASGWSVTTGNELLGSPCTWPELPTMLPSDTSAIDYSGLSLTGTIPTQLGLYTLATTMDLGENTLTGTIPSELGNLVKMESGFVCYSNQLSGAVPTELGQLRTISKLFKLHTNQLTSSIPTQLGQVTPETHAFPSPHTIETPSTKSKAADFHGTEISIPSVHPVVCTLGSNPGRNQILLGYTKAEFPTVGLSGNFWKFPFPEIFIPVSAPTLTKRTHPTKGRTPSTF